MSKQSKLFLIAFFSLIFFLVLTLTLVNPIYLFLVIVPTIAVIIVMLFLSNKWKLFHYLCILITLVVLSPLVRVPGSPWEFRLDDFWIALGMVVMLLRLIVKKDITFVFPSYAKIFTVFIAWAAITIVLSVYREPELHSYRDWTEFYKNGKLLLILLLGVNVRFDELHLKKFINVTISALLVSALFGIGQYFNFLNINFWLTPHYIFESNYQSLIINRRVIGTFGNPNIFAGALLVGISLVFSGILYKFKIKQLLILFIFLVALTMTLSRTTIILCAVMICLILFFVFIQTKRKVSSVVILFMSPLILISVWKLAPDLLFKRMSQFSDLSSTPGYQVRIANWKHILESRTLNNIITGTGPTSKLPITFDNEWLMLITHFGVVGVILFLSMFFLIYRKLRKANNFGFYNIAVRSLMLVLVVYMVFLPVFELLSLMPIIILLMGILLGAEKSQKKELVSNIAQVQ